MVLFGFQKERVQQFRVSRSEVEEVQQFREWDILQCFVELFANLQKQVYNYQGLPTW